MASRTPPVCLATGRTGRASAVYPSCLECPSVVLAISPAVIAGGVLTGPARPGRRRIFLLAFLYLCCYLQCASRQAGHLHTCWLSSGRSCLALGRVGDLCGVCLLLLAACWSISAPLLRPSTALTWLLVLPTAYAARLTQTAPTEKKTSRKLSSRSLICIHTYSS